MTSGPRGQANQDAVGGQRLQIFLAQNHAAAAGNDRARLPAPFDGQRGFHVAESGLAVFRENGGDGFSGTAFEFGIHVEERAIRPLGNAAAKGAFARAHEAQ